MSAAADRAEAQGSQASVLAPSRRWWVLTLLFLSIAMNLMDRQVLSLTAPLIRDELGLSNTQYSVIIFFFLVGMTSFQLPVGRLIDRYGARIGLAAIMVFWSIVNSLHATARGFWHLCTFRFLLGAGECGNYSGGIKVISQWFPPHERAFAGGIFNSGTVVGAAAAPLIIVPLSLQLGWRWAFVIPSLLGLVWLIPWLKSYRDRLPPETGTADDARGGPVRPKAAAPPLGRLLAVRQVWGAAMVRAFGGPVTHFYWYWLPEYLRRERGFSMQEIGWTAGVPYIFAGLGNVLGGGFSSYLMRRGMPADPARKTAVTVSVGLSAASVAVPFAPTAVLAFGFICTASFGIAMLAATHIGMLTDLFPSNVLARLVGVTGFAEGIMNMVLMVATGVVVDRFSYLPVFVAAGLMPLLAGASVFLLIRRIERVEL